MTQKIIFITGATAGFGEATARLFAKNGWKVVATGRRLERLEKLQNALGKDKVHIAQMDLTDHASIKNAIDNLPNEFKPIDCLLNNGGLALGLGSIPDIKIDDWRIMVETNIMGLILTTQEMIPLLKQAGRGASIINIGSVAARNAYPGGNTYGATKAFVSQFSYNLRTDLAGSDIRVTELAPGMAKSEFMKVRTYGDDDVNESFYEGLEPILPEDIANNVWFIANQPDHININMIEIMPLCQVPGRPEIIRK
ncbi:MAG: SDR family NAD(P)-dependent oxidoreductase [Devosiaceae bacterium]|nr:SDR family NAD(P)-dependent oxidoreductase [Devosiaceae bacterium]